MCEDPCTCAFHTKAFNAKSAGAGAVVLYDNAVATLLNPTVVGVPAITAPVVGLSSLARGSFQHQAVLFCSAACKGTNESFTVDPHPDVGEGASPLPVRPGRAF